MKKISKIEKVLDQIQTPCYVCEEELLEENLKLLNYIQNKADAKILLALKGFSLYSTFDLVGKYLGGCCASGLNEAKLARFEMNKQVHTYSPAFKDQEFDEIVSISDHVVFNSFAQWKKFKKRAYGKVSCGFRINPEVSESPADIYNPCALNSRLGITKKEFDKEDESILEGIEGLHFHALCEQNADALEMVLKGFEDRFAKFIPKMKWINFGGGHHITRDDYDIEKLIEIIKDFKKRYEGVDVYLEPGEAVGWQSGSLIASVLDIVHNGIDIAILDTSAEAHMIDTLIMPYRADVRGAVKAQEKKYTYRLGGNTCLAGDIMGDYSFDKQLKVGDKIIFEDMIHYTMVKTTTFNGINLPSIAILRKDGTLEVIKKFGYEEFKSRI